ncbi:MAG: AAA family ATPase [Desulfobacterales bacterium]|nr:AAA family ATPase [Desulfobacterales bacterium]
MADIARAFSGLGSRLPPEYRQLDDAINPDDGHVLSSFLDDAAQIPGLPSSRREGETMRILQLHLIRYGHFRDMTIDFGRDEGRAHVIFGSNEAGKSTILRSISGLLFGIPETTRDDHLHRKSDLRIGATIGSSRGDLLTFVRRKGRKQTLLDGDGKALDDGVITSWLGGVGRELFDTLFGLSHERLLRGGEDLLAGRGEMGERPFQRRRRASPGSTRSGPAFGRKQMRYSGPRRTRCR